MELYLVRHTTPQIAAGICYGHSDLDVAASFSMELNTLLEKLNHLQTAEIYSSPLRRCLKLAEATSAALNFGAVQLDDRLKELDFGDWEMKSWLSIPQSEMKLWADDFVRQSPPNGESFHTLHARAKQFLAETVMSENPHPKLVFTHSGVIRALVTEIQQQPLEYAFELEIDYASVTKLNIADQQGQIDFLNL
jgi:alpha-ribazole phosphatase